MGREGNATKCSMLRSVAGYIDSCRQHQAANGSFGKNLNQPAGGSLRGAGRTGKNVLPGNLRFVCAVSGQRLLLAWGNLRVEAKWELAICGYPAGFGAGISPMERGLRGTSGSGTGHAEERMRLLGVSPLRNTRTEA